jgi:hypothetical protein
VQLFSELQACLREFAAAGPAELLENGERIAPLSTWSSIVPAREAQLLQDRGRKELNALLPASREAISYHPNLSAREVVVRFRGLTCLRWYESEIYFGSREIKSKWNPGRNKESQQIGNWRSLVIRWLPKPGARCFGRRQSAGWSFWCGRTRPGWIRS